MDRILIMSVDLTMIDGSSDVRSAVLRRVLDRTGSLPEVATLALVDRAPFLGTGSDQFENEDHRQLKCRFNVVSGGYSNTLEIPILTGRSFSQTEAERGDADVVVSEAAARFYWPDQNPLGRRIFLEPQTRNGLPHASYTVIGVAKVVRNTFLSKVGQLLLVFSQAGVGCGRMVAGADATFAGVGATYSAQCPDGG